jgi:hypothetical protein
MNQHFEKRSSGHRTGDRNGMALLVVVVLVMLIALGAYRFSFYMESQYRLTRLHEEQVHARLAAVSGMELAAAMVELPEAQRISLGGLFENAGIFRNVSIDSTANAPTDTADQKGWRFSLVSPAGMDAAGNSQVRTSQVVGRSSLPIRFGLVNESAKLHIPTLLAWDRMKPGHARSTLLALPGVTESLVDAWLLNLGVSARFERDESKNQRASMEDLRFAWSGGDLNQNYQLDPLEMRFASQHYGLSSGTSQPSMDASNAEGGFKPLQRYLTWHSGHRNTTRDGQPKIYLNESDLQSLHRKLSMVWPSDWANFVIAMRQFGPSNALDSLANTAPNTPEPQQSKSSNASTSDQSSPRAAVTPLPPFPPQPFNPNPQPPIPYVPATAGTAASRPLSGNSTTIPPAIASSQAAIVQDWTPDFGKAATFTFRSPLDLIGAIVEMPPSGVSSNASNQTGQPSTINQSLRNPFSSDLGEVRNYLGRLLDAATVELSPISEGRVDVSDAPVEVLAGVPVLDFPTAQRLVQQRSASTNSTSTQQTDSIAWLLEVVDLNKLKELEPYLTCRSDVYSVQSVGYRDSQSAVYRITATIDARQNPTHLRDQKVWHPWDRGFPIEQLADLKP